MGFTEDGKERDLESIRGFQNLLLRIRARHVCSHFLGQSSQPHDQVRYHCGRKDSISTRTILLEGTENDVAERGSITAFPSSLVSTFFLHARKIVSVFLKEKSPKSPSQLSVELKVQDLLFVNK